MTTNQLIEYIKSNNKDLLKQFEQLVDSKLADKPTKTGQSPLAALAAYDDPAFPPPTNCAAPTANYPPVGTVCYLAHWGGTGKSPIYNPETAIRVKVLGYWYYSKGFNPSHYAVVGVYADGVGNKVPSITSKINPIHSQTQQIGMFLWKPEQLIPTTAQFSPWGTKKISKYSSGPEFVSKTDTGGADLFDDEGEQETAAEAANS